jgi:predicted AAA+ superfamily ATPase
LRRLFPRATYRLLEDPDILARVRSDPRGFLSELAPPAILDEVQNAPEILAYVRTRIDAAPRRCGQWILTGSQDAPLMQGVTESLAGRAAVFQLLPLSTVESDRVSLLHGGFPEVVGRRSAAAVWFRSYVQTYLERDVRAITAVRDLATFRRFLALLASRCGQMLNRTDLAGPLGVSVPTISRWLGVMEVTGQIILVPPFFESFGKRLVKSPKLYFVDSGLACHFLGIESERVLDHSPFLEALFEGFIAAEIVKHQIGVGGTRQLYYFRDQQGLEVDFVVPVGHRKLLLLEAKASGTVMPQTTASMDRLASAIRRYEITRFVVHRPQGEARRVSALRPGVRAGALTRLLALLPRATR